MPCRGSLRGHRVAVGPPSGQAARPPSVASFRLVRARHVLLLVLLAACLAGLADSAASSAGASVRRVPPVQKVSLLYVVNASSGTLVPSGGGFTLSLRVDPQAVWFSDRPARRTGVLPSAGLAAGWRGFGFAAQAPNAALDYGSTVILRLASPRYANGWLRFQATRIAPAAAGANLATRARATDTAPRRRFGRAALFIDDTSAPVIGGCILQPWTFCPHAALAGSNLSRLDLTGADFEGANLAGSSFALATLAKADFGAANLTRVDLLRADLTGASFVGADISDSDLTGATGFDPTGLAARCNTTLPDGTITGFTQQC